PGAAQGCAGVRRGEAARYVQPRDRGALRGVYPRRGRGRALAQGPAAVGGADRQQRRPAAGADVKLSDSDWHTLLEGVGPLPKGAKLVRARRELAKCLRDYPGLRRDRAKLRAALLRWQQIDKLATDLYAMLAEEWRRKRWRYNPL